MKQFIWAILLVLFTATGVSSTVKILPGEKKELPVSFDYIIDKEGSLSFAEVREAEGFTRDKRTNFGFTSDSVWVRFLVEVNEPLTDNWFLEISYPLLDKIEVYFPRKDGSYVKDTYGDLLPFSRRPVRHQNFLLPLPGYRGRYTCYLKISSTSAIAIPLTVVHEDVIADKTRNENMVLGLFYGALLVMLLYNILLALSLRNLTYLWYSAYIASMLFLSLTMNGYGFQYLWPRTPWMNDATPFGVFFVALWLGLFARLFLNLKELSPLLSRISYFFITFYFLGAAAAWFFPYSIAIVIAAASLIPGILYIFICIGVGILKRVRQSQHFLYAFLVLFIGVFISVFHRFGFFPNNIFTLWGYHGGAVFSVALLSIGLADRLNSLKNELLVLNLGLEEKVVERTRELADAKEEIEAAMTEVEAINENLTAANHDLEASKSIYEQDLRMAVHVQEAFFPKEAPVSEEYDIAFRFFPLSGVSGDFYDFYIDEKALRGIGLFDVSGHGIASGLLTLIARSIIYRNISSGETKDLGVVMKDINAELIEEIGRVDNYLTGLLFRFKGSQVEYVNCGHADPILLRRNGDSEGGSEEPALQQKKGTFLGIEMMACDYQAVTLHLEPGDMLVFYTDGLSEGTDSEEEQFGEQRIHDILSVTRGVDPDEVLYQLMKDYFDFIGGEEKMEDDLTIVCLVKK